MSKKRFESHKSLKGGSKTAFMASIAVQRYEKTPNDHKSKQSDAGEVKKDHLQHPIPKTSIKYRQIASK